VNAWDALFGAHLETLQQASWFAGNPVPQFYIKTKEVNILLLMFVSNVKGLLQ
jgi:hypothetical protein